MILSLEHSVPERLKKSFTKMFVFTLTAITLLYLSFGWCGYLSFGPDTRDLITMNLDPPEDGGWHWAEFIRYCLAVALTFTYPVMLFPVIKLLKPRLENFFGCSKVSTFLQYYSEISIVSFPILRRHNPRISTLQSGKAVFKILYQLYHKL